MLLQAAENQSCRIGCTYRNQGHGLSIPEAACKTIIIILEMYRFAQ
jgi:hypothetical protein